MAAGHVLDVDADAVARRRHERSASVDVDDEQRLRGRLLRRSELRTRYPPEPPALPSRCPRCCPRRIRPEARRPRARPRPTIERLRRAHVSTCVTRHSRPPCQESKREARSPRPRPRSSLLCHESSAVAAGVTPTPPVITRRRTRRHENSRRSARTGPPPDGAADRAVPGAEYRKAPPEGADLSAVGGAIDRQPPGNAGEEPGWRRRCASRSRGERHGVRGVRAHRARSRRAPANPPPSRPPTSATGEGVPAADTTLRATRRARRLRCRTRGHSLEDARAPSATAVAGRENARACVSPRLSTVARVTARARCAASVGDGPPTQAERRRELAGYVGLGVRRDDADLRRRRPRDRRR